MSHNFLYIIRSVKKNENIIRSSSVNLAVSFGRARKWVYTVSPWQLFRALLSIYTLRRVFRRKLCPRRFCTFWRQQQQSLEENMELVPNWNFKNLKFLPICLRGREETNSTVSTSDGQVKVLWFKCNNSDLLWMIWTKRF